MGGDQRLAAGLQDENELQAGRHARFVANDLQGTVGNGLVSAPPGSLRNRPASYGRVWSFKNNELFEWAPHRIPTEDARG